MMKLFSRFLGDRRGASAVEFALVVIPFLLLCFGIIEVGRALWTRQVLADVAILGARCMGVRQLQCSEGEHYSADKTRRFIIAELSGRGVAVAQQNVVLDANASCDGVPGFSMVTISRQFSTALPFNDIFNLSGTACFPNQKAE